MTHTLSGSPSVSLTPTATRSPTPTTSLSDTPTMTFRRTHSFSATVTHTWTTTHSSTQSNTPTCSTTYSATSSQPLQPTCTLSHSPTITASHTATHSLLPALTDTRSPTPSLTCTHTASLLAAPTATASLTTTKSGTSSPTRSGSVTRTASRELRPTHTHTATPTASVALSWSASLTATRTNTLSPSASSSHISSPSLTHTRTVSSSPSISLSASSTFSPSPSTSCTLSPSPTGSGSGSGTASRTCSPSHTFSALPAGTSTRSVSFTVSDSPTVTVSLTATPSLSAWATHSRSSSPSRTATLLATLTSSRTGTHTCTVPHTHTSSLSRTRTLSPTATLVPFTFTRSSSGTSSATVSVSFTRTCSNTPTGTASTSDTQSSSSSATVSTSPSFSPTATASYTPSDTLSLADAIWLSGIECQATLLPGSPAPYCTSGGLLVMKGTGFGHGRGRTRVIFDNGPSPIPPSCEIQQVSYTQLQCLLMVAASSAGTWRVDLWVDQVLTTNVTLLAVVALPPPSIRGIEGCGVAGCVSGNTLTLRGLSFAPAGSAVTFTRLAASIGQTPTCAILSANGSQVTCDLQLGGTSGGQWGISLVVMDQASGMRLLQLQNTVVSPWVDSVMCNGTLAGSGATCRCGQLLVIQGSKLNEGQVSVLFQPDPTNPPPTGASAPTCILQATTGTLLSCGLRVPAGSAGAWLLVLLFTDTGVLSNALPIAVDVLPAPQLSGVVPCGGGRCYSGDVLTVQGANFFPYAAATFNALRLSQLGSPAGPTCAILTATPTWLTCQLALPAGVAGNWSLSVAVLGVSAASTVALPLDGSAPTVTALRCDGNPLGGGTYGCRAGSPVTLTGTGFGAALGDVAVTLSGGVGVAPQCVPLAVQPRQLQCGLSAGAQTGTWSIGLTVASQSAAQAWALVVVPLDAPSVANVTGCPADGCLAGMTLTLAGANFDPFVPSANALTFQPAGASCAPLASTNQSLTCLLAAMQDGAYSLQLSVHGVAASGPPLSVYVQPLTNLPVPHSVLCGAEMAAGGSLACRGGQTITVTGSGFGTGATVSFEGSADTTPSCTPRSVLDTRVLCSLEVPAGAAGAWRLFVTRQGVRSAANVSLAVAVAPPPAGLTVVGCGAGQGACRSGDVLTVAGQHFDPLGQTAVAFLPHPLSMGAAPNCTFLSSTCTQVTCQMSVPDGTFGRWYVNVVTFDFLSASVYGEVDVLSGPPNVTNISCAATTLAGATNLQLGGFAMSLLGGQPLTLSGSNFQENSTVVVVFSGALPPYPTCTVLEVVSSRIVCALALPFLAGPDWTLQAVVDGVASRPFSLHAIGLAQPSITSISGCSSAACYDGDVLTVTGANFYSLEPARNVLSLSVTWDRAPSCPMLTATATQLTCVMRVLPGSSGTMPLLITVLNYRSPAGPPLTFVRGTPALQSVGCNGTGPCVGGTLLTVTGTDFGGVGNASTTALVFSGVAALRPLCPLLTLRPTRLVCQLGVWAGSAGTWSVQVRVGTLLTAALPLNVTTPAPVVLLSAGCPSGCRHGAQLRLTGLNFDTLVAARNLVVFSNTSTSLGPAPSCGNVSATATNLTCTLAVPYTTAGDWRVGTSTLGVPSAASLALYLQPTPPTVSTVQCLASSDPTTLPHCIAGANLTLLGAAFDNSSTVQLAGPYPATCNVTTVRPNVLQCQLAIPLPATPDLWSLTATTLPALSASTTVVVPLAPMPAPIIAALAGCLWPDRQGCAVDAVPWLTVVGYHFRAANVSVQFRPTALSAGPTPTCTAAQWLPGSPDSDDCEAGAPPDAIACRLSRDRYASGEWQVVVTVAGQTSDPFVVELTTITLTPTATLTASDTETATQIPRRITIIPQYSPPNIVYGGLTHILRVQLASGGDTQVVITAVGPATLAPLSGTVPCVLNASAALPTLVCAVGTIPFLWLPAQLTVSKTYYTTGVASVNVTAELWSTPGPGLPLRLYATARYTAAVLAGDLDVRLKDVTYGGLVLPGTDVPISTTVTNVGAGYVVGPVVTVELPGFGLVIGAAAEMSAQWLGPGASQPITCVGQSNGRVQVCTWAELPPGSSVLLRYTGITVSTTAQGTFTVVAQATSASPDTNATNNAAFLNLRADALQVVLTLDPTATTLTGRFGAAIMVQGYAPGGLVPCAALVGPSNVTALGAGAVCWWVSDAQVAVTLGDNATVQPGMMLQFLQGYVRPRDTPTFGAFYGSVLLPVAPSPPIAVLATSPVVATCDVVRLDATASRLGTRRRGFAWALLAAANVTDRNATVAAVRQFLAAQGGQEQVIVPASLLGEGQFLFAVTVWDYFGTESQATATVQKTTVAPPTLVLLTPSPAAVVSYLPLTLQASAHTVRCQGDAAPAPQFQWRCTSHLDLLIGAVVDVDALQLPAFSLQPGAEYLFMVTAVDPETGRYTNMPLTVDVLRQPVEVLVQGSTVRYVSAVGDLKIDASQSYDPDEPSASIAFQWAACYEGAAFQVQNMLQGGSCDPTALDTTSPLPPAAFRTGSATAPVLLLVGTAANPFPTGWWKFAVTCYAVAKATTAVVFVEFEAVPLPLTVDILRPVEVRTAAHNADQQLALTASVLPFNSGARLAWTVTTPLGLVLNLSDPTEAPLGGNGPLLLLSPLAMVGLASLQVALNATLAGQSVSAELFLPLNQPPSGGRLAAMLLPVYGAAPQVQLLAMDWLDEDEALRYQFYLYHEASGSMLALMAEPSPANTYLMAVPFGRPGQRLRFEVRVYDSLGASSQAFANSTITATPLTQTQLDDILTAVNTSTPVTADRLQDIQAYLDAKAAADGNVTFPSPPPTGVILDLLAGIANLSLTPDQRDAWFTAAAAMSAEPAAASGQLLAAGERLWNFTGTATLPVLQQLADLTLQLVQRQISALVPSNVSYEVHPGEGFDPFQPAQPRSNALVEAMSSRFVRSGWLVAGQSACSFLVNVSWCVTMMAAEGPTEQTLPGVAVSVPNAWPGYSFVDRQPYDGVQAVGLNTLYFRRNAYGLSTAVLSLRTASAAVQLQGATDAPVAFRLSVPAVLQSTRNRPVVCAYVDDDVQAVRLSGVNLTGFEVFANSTEVQCLTSHMTEFLIGISAPQYGAPNVTTDLTPSLPWWTPLPVWAAYGLVLLGYAAYRFRRSSIPMDVPAAEAKGPRRHPLLQRFLQRHDWLVVMAEPRTLPVPRQATLLFLAAMGAMMGNAWFLDSLGPVPSVPIALGLILVARVVVNALLRGTPADPPPAPSSSDRKPWRPPVGAEGAALAVANPLTPGGRPPADPAKPPPRGPRLSTAALAPRAPAEVAPADPGAAGTATLGGPDSIADLARRLAVDADSEDDTDFGLQGPPVPLRTRLSRKSIAYASGKNATDPGDLQDSDAEDWEAPSQSGTSFSLPDVVAKALPVRPSPARRASRWPSSAGRTDRSLSRPSSGSRTTTPGTHGGPGMITSPRASSGLRRPNLERLLAPEGNLLLLPLPADEPPPDHNARLEALALAGAAAGAESQRVVTAPRPAPRLPQPSVVQLEAELLGSGDDDSDSDHLPSLLAGIPRPRGYSSPIMGMPLSMATTSPWLRPPAAPERLAFAGPETPQKLPLPLEADDSDDDDDDNLAMGMPLRALTTYGSPQVGTRQRLPFAGTVQTDIVRQYLQSGHLLVACHIMLRSAGTVAEARRLCRELMDWTQTEFQRLWEADEGRCHLWQQAVDEVGRQDWHAAKAFFYGSLLGRTAGSMPVGGISPDRMDPWLQFYTETLHNIPAADFWATYQAHAGGTIDVVVPLFPRRVPKALEAPGVAQGQPVAPAAPDAVAQHYLTPSHHTRTKPGRRGRTSRPSSGQSRGAPLVLYVRPRVPGVTEADGSRAHPYHTVEHAVMNAGDHCEIVLLDGAYPPFTINTDRAGVTVRAVGEGVVVRAEGWHGGPLVTVVSARGLSLADLRLEAAAVGVAATAAPGLAVLNCHFRDVRKPIVEDGQARPLNVVRSLNTVHYTSPLARLLVLRLPYRWVALGYGLALAYAVFCSAATVLVPLPASQQPLWVALVCLTLLFDAVLLQPLLIAAWLALRGPLDRHLYTASKARGDGGGGGPSSGPGEFL